MAVAKGKLKQPGSTALAEVAADAGPILNRPGLGKNHEQAEKRLRRRDANLAEAQRIAHIGSWEWDIVKNSLSWSDEIYRVFGLEPQAFGATYEAFLNSVHPDDRELVRAAMNRALKDDEPYIILHRIVLPHGEVRIVHERGEIFRNATGKAVRMVGTIQDVTDVRRMQTELLESEERYRRLVENVSDVVYSVDGETEEFAYLNPSFAEMLGYTEQDVVDAGGRVIFMKNVIGRQFAERQRKKFREMKEKGRADESGCWGAWWKTNSGERKYIQDRWKAYYREGKLVYTAGVLRDLTKLRLAEELEVKSAELERSNADLEQFAYVASHDLQEPLRMVTSYLQLLQRRYADKLDHDADEFIGYAVDGAARMKDLIDDLLAYSRVGTRGNPFEPTDCNQVLAEVLNTLRAAIEENKVEVTHDPLPRIVADKLQMVQLFQNLISNAIKFNNTDRPEVHVGSKRKKGEYVLSVRDNGIGIKPEFRERIFLIFQRLHGREEYPGSGIGLSICRKIVERHGGRIWVESQPGKGSTFYFSLSRRKEH